MTSPFHDELVERAIVIDGHADLLGMLAEPQVLQRAVAALAEPFSGAGVTKVVGLEARGFIFGSGVALELEAGFVPARKPGEHPSGRQGARRDAPGLARPRGDASGPAVDARRARPGARRRRLG